MALFSFLVGMMLGRVFEEPKTSQYSSTVVQLQSYANGLGICLSAPTQVHAQTEKGIYQLLLLNSKGQAAQGELALAEGQPVRWRVEPQETMMRVVFIGLQPVLGQWRARDSDELWCVDVQLTLSTHWDE